MNEIAIYQNKDKKIEVQLKNETIWIDAHQISELFDVQRPAVVKHITNIYLSEELEERLTCSISEQVAADGKKRKMKLYNLDIIIAVGYRINSKKATQFRIWANQVIKKYLTKDYVLNEKNLSIEKLNELEGIIKLIKNHPFIDGNKRIGVLLFLIFLYENINEGELYRKFNNNVLTALSYLIAASPPRQKDQMINLIMNFISFDIDGELM